MTPDVLAISHACLVGVNRTVYRELIGLGWNVEILVPADWRIQGKVVASDESRDGEPRIHKLPVTSSHPRFYTYDGLAAFLDRAAPRLVLLDSDPASRLGVQVGRWAQRSGAKLICQSCENLSRGFKESFRRSGYRGLLSASLVKVLNGLAAPAVNHVLVISRDGERVFDELGYEGRVTRIPLGFDSRLFAFSAEKRRETRTKLGLNATTIAYFGRLTPEKGVHLLIEALGRLRESNWQLLIDRFDLYGDQYRERLGSQITSLGLQDRVVYFDATHEEMPDYMNAADITVLPSISTPAWKEQYGRVAPEAMACGSVVVVSDSGTLPELVGDAGLVVPEGDTEALSAALRTLLENGELRAELGVAAAERARRELSAGRQASILDRCFRQLIGTPARLPVEA